MIIERHIPGLTASARSVALRSGRSFRESEGRSTLLTLRFVVIWHEPVCIESNSDLSILLFLVNFSIQLDGMGMGEN